MGAVLGDILALVQSSQPTGRQTPSPTGVEVVLDPRAGGPAEVSLRHLPPFFREPLSCFSLRGGDSDVRGEHDQKRVIWPLWASVFSSQRWVRDFSPAFRVGVRVGQALCVPVCSGIKGRGVPPRSTSVLCIPGVLAGGDGGVASNHCLCHTRPVDPPESGPQTQHTWCPLTAPWLLAQGDRTMAI